MQLTLALAAAELFRCQAVDGAVQLVVAEQALGAAGEVPVEFAASAGDVFVGEKQSGVAAFAIGQLGVGSVGVPDKTVCLPKTIDELQYLSFEFARGELGGLAGFVHRHGESFGENSAVRKTPLALAKTEPLIGAGMPVEPAEPGDGDQPLGDRAVLPHRRLNVVGVGAGSRLEGFEVAEKAGVTEPCRERLGRSAGGVGYQTVQRAPVIDHQQFAFAVDAEADDLMRSVGQLSLFRHLFAIVAQAPDTAGGVVAINIHAVLFRQLFSAVNVAAGDGARLGVGVLHNRCSDRRRAGGVVRVNRLAAFHDAPTVVAAPLNTENHLP